MSEQRICIGSWESPKYTPSETVSHSPEEIIAGIKSCEEILNDVRRNSLHNLRKEAVAEIVSLFSAFPSRSYKVWFSSIYPPSLEEGYAEWCDVKVLYELERNPFHKILVESYIKDVYLDDSGIITVRTTRNDEVHLAVVENPENVLSYILRAEPFGRNSTNGKIYY